MLMVCALSLLDRLLNDTAAYCRKDNLSDEDKMKTIPILKSLCCTLHSPCKQAEIHTESYQMSMATLRISG